MAEPLETLAVDTEQLAAPGAAVGTEPEAVEREPEQRSIDMMLGRQRGDMRVMVLHRSPRRPEPMGEPRGRKIGMQVAGNRHRLDLEDRQHVAKGFLEKCDGYRRVEVTDMLRDERLAAARDRHRCLELSPQGDDARHLMRQTDRHGCE